MKRAIRGGNTVNKGFISSYLKGIFLAARWAGYSEKTARQVGTKNLSKPVIETYQSYIDTGAIVDLQKNKAGSELELVFKATYGKPIMLINATAQVALTHHLDDEKRYPGSEIGLRKDQNIINEPGLYSTQSRDRNAKFASGF